MPQYLEALERAFQIARSGRVCSVVEVKKALKGEGFDPRALEGRSLTRQLTQIIREVRAPSAVADPCEPALPVRSKPSG
jgi:hypothetical protein